LIRSYPALFALASPTQKHNVAFVKQIVQTDALQLEFASDDIQNNYDVVMLAVHADGKALQFASARLKNNKELMLAALKTDFWAFTYGDDDHFKRHFSKDPVVILAVEQAQQRWERRVQAMHDEQVAQLLRSARSHLLAQGRTQSR